MKIQTATLFMFTFCIFACTTTEISEYQYQGFGTSFPLNLSIDDYPKERLFFITYKNETGFDVCVPKITWPQDGALGEWDEENRVHIGSREFTYKGVKTKLCVERCEIRVSDGNSLTGYIPYNRYNIPEELFDEHKVLKLRVDAQKCN